MFNKRAHLLVKKMLMLFNSIL